MTVIASDKRYRSNPRNWIATPPSGASDDGEDATRNSSEAHRGADDRAVHGHVPLEIVVVVVLMSAR